jgi:hypothetical protein
MQVRGDNTADRIRRQRFSAMSLWILSFPEACSQNGFAAVTLLSNHCPTFNLETLAEMRLSCAATNPSSFLEHITKNEQSRLMNSALA